jgi:hypothetical protein
MTQAAYIVTINDDGSITTESVGTDKGVTRKASTFDIYQTSKELVSEIEQQILADKVAHRVVLALQPKDEAAETRAKIIDALNERKQEAPLD